MADLKTEINKRRTFAIISHPDAGKTTLTEKFLLYGGAINEAGTVKGKKNSKHAVSDWMEIEKQRGISVTSSVLQFNYQGYCINILDTPGHQDFSEDTYRTLMAADSAVMVIDAAKGIEPQTRKLFKVCAMRHIPVFTFINKLDREAKNPFDLLEELENEFNMDTYPVNWPIGCGRDFKGVYDREKRQIVAFADAHSGKERIKPVQVEINQTEKLDELIGETLRETLVDDVELLDGASREFCMESVQNGSLTPVFFGSALTNFGIEQFLESFLQMTTTPLARVSNKGEIEPTSKEFSGFVFKIQANMNKAHRDRIAFVRICSGKYEKGMEVYHVQSEKPIKLAQSTQMMAQQRETVEEAYAGDIIGIFDPGIFSIGDTLCQNQKDCFSFEGIPTFAPEHFALISQVDTMKRKQFVKGISQIAQEGAIQTFKELGSGMEEVIVGVVGTLQFEVLEHRLNNEYNVDIRMNRLPYQHIRWVKNKGIDAKTLSLTSDTKRIEDLKGNLALIFTNSWGVNWALEHNKGLELLEFNNN